VEVVQLAAVVVVVAAHVAGQPLAVVVLPLQQEGQHQQQQPGKVPRPVILKIS
jgi:hypothetical protein